MEKTKMPDRKHKPETESDRLDDALDDTFPASDPPAMTAAHGDRDPKTENRSKKNRR